MVEGMRLRLRMWTNEFEPAGCCFMYRPCSFGGPESSRLHELLMASATSVLLVLQRSVYCKCMLFFEFSVFSYSC